MWLHLIRPCPPNAQKEFIKHPAANRVHRVSTSPPSLWPSRELRKYHYSLCLSSPHRKQSGFRCISFIARFHKEGRDAPTTQLRVSPAQVMYLMNVYSIFKVHRRTFLISEKMSSSYSQRKPRKVKPLSKKIKKFSNK